MADTIHDREHPFRGWIPKGALSSIRHEVTGLVENVIQTARPLMGHATFPAVDVLETADAVVVIANVPGFSRDQLTVEVGEKSLQIAGQQPSRDDQPAPDTRAVQTERHVGSFLRTLWLPCPVVEDNVQAELQQGVLTLRFPKRVETGRRQVEIRQLDAAPTSESGE